MRYTQALAAVTAASISGVRAQRPADTPICDYYTTALLKNNTAANQATLLTLVVNTVVIGNYTQPNVGLAVPGILAPGEYNGTKVNLLPYFDGTLLSTNRGGSSGVSVNFLDGGGAEPLKKNMPANDKTSNQYFLLTHLYEFFGSLLGCTMQGMAGFDAYTADPSMYQVHKFMALSEAETAYFIEQVGLAAASFGVTQEDATAVGMALNKLFGLRCAPETTVIPAQGPALQAICIDETCPLSPNATCAAYAPVVKPAQAGGGGGSATSSMVPMPSQTYPTQPPGGEPMSMPSGSASMPTTSMMMPMNPTAHPTTTQAIPTAGAATNAVNVAAAIVVGAAAYLL